MFIYIYNYDYYMKDSDSKILIRNELVFNAKYDNNLYIVMKVNYCFVVLLP